MPIATFPVRDPDPDPFLEWLQKQITAHDKIAAGTEWTVDAEIHNGIAHSLRRTRDEYKRQKSQKADA